MEFGILIAQRPSRNRTQAVVAAAEFYEVADCDWHDWSKESQCYSAGVAVAYLDLQIALLGDWSYGVVLFCIGFVLQYLVVVLKAQKRYQNHGDHENDNANGYAK